MQKSRGARRAFSSNIGLRSADGTYRWMLDSGIPRFDTNGEFDGFIGSVVDVTRHREAEQVLRRSNAELEALVAQRTEEFRKAENARQASKMEAIGQLTGGVAHDFNNLLTIIIGNLESLQAHLDRWSATGGMRARRDNAMRGREAAAALTQRLLAFSRRQPLDPKPIDINRLVTGMSDFLRRTLGETIDVETVLGGGALAGAKSIPIS